MRSKETAVDDDIGGQAGVWKENLFPASVPDVEFSIVQVTRGRGQLLIFVVFLLQKLRIRYVSWTSAVVRPSAGLTARELSQTAPFLISVDTSEHFCFIFPSLK